MSQWGQLSFQDGCSFMMLSLISFHDLAMVVTVSVVWFVGCGMSSLFFNRLHCRNVLEAQKVETVWTIMPGVVLLCLGFPSLNILYLIEEFGGSPLMAMKIIGHQWFWEYEYSQGSSKLQFDSYMVSSEELVSGESRLLEVDNRMVVPVEVSLRLIVSAADVLHAWGVSSLGVKIDAVPGRLNQTSVEVIRAGVFYGQCSEICGANHSFMPIVVEAVDFDSFVSWCYSWEVLCTGLFVNPTQF